MSIPRKGLRLRARFVAFSASRAVWRSYFRSWNRQTRRTLVTRIHIRPFEGRRYERSTRANKRT
jgi:hypothetical protein